MALTAQEETALKGLVSGMTAAELAAMKVAGQKQQISDLRAAWNTKKSNLDTAIALYLQALNDGDAALNKQPLDQTAIDNAKAAIVSAKQALTAALEAAK